MPSQKHIHSYVQFKSRPGYFRCAAPDCTHFLIREAVIGKYSKCLDCGSQFTIDFENSKLRTPKCLMCRTTKKAIAFQKGQELMAKMVNFSISDGAPVSEKTDD